MLSFLAMWLFWLGYMLVITELSERLNIQKANVLVRMAKDWPRAR